MIHKDIQHLLVTRYFDNVACLLVCKQWYEWGKKSIIAKILAEIVRKDQLEWLQGRVFPTDWKSYGICSSCNQVVKYKNLRRHLRKSSQCSQDSTINKLPKCIDCGAYFPNDTWSPHTRMSCTGPSFANCPLCHLSIILDSRKSFRNHDCHCTTCDEKFKYSDVWKHIYVYVRHVINGCYSWILSISITI